MIGADYYNYRTALMASFLRIRLLYRPQLVVDGNMKLVHLQMKHPDKDVSLSDGELFMVSRTPYAEHLGSGIDSQPIRTTFTYRRKVLISGQRSTCNNHRAQNNGDVRRPHLDSTGKGACACARHGAMIPHCVVDFQKGERYVIITIQCGQCGNDMH